MAIIVSACFAYVRRESSGCSNVEIRLTKLEGMTNDQGQIVVAYFLLSFGRHAEVLSKANASASSANLILSKNLASSI